MNTNNQLKSIIERIENLTEQKKELSDDIKEIINEAKSSGFDTKAIRTVLKLRKISPQERKMAEEIVDLYLNTVGEI